MSAYEKAGRSAKALSSMDVRHVVGPVTDDTISAILRSESSMEELELAASYLRGEGSKVDRLGHSMTGKVAQLYDILSADALYDDNEP
jgi:hypothetical protein